MLRRQVIVGGVAGLSAVLAAACGPQPGGGAGGGGETAAAPRGVGQTETSLLWQEELPPDIEQGLDAFLAEWRQKYPKVKIEAVNYGGGDSQKIEKILAQAAGGTPVDVVGKLTFMQPLARPGAVRPLEPFIKRDRVDLVQFNKGWLERFGTLDGKLYSLPWGLGGDAMAFIYSTDALREVGLKPPSADWKSPFTYDEYRDYARRLTKRDGDNYLRVGAEGLGNELSVPPREFEGKWLSDDGKTVVCDSQPMVDAYTRYTDLIIKDRSTAVTPGVTLSASGNDGHFSNGQAAMSYIGGWQMNFFTNPTKYKVDYAIATFPKGTKSSPAIDAIQLALGNNTQRVRINGSTVITPPNQTSATSAGGLLAQPTNIGTYERSDFTAIPNLSMNLGYQWTCHLRSAATLSNEPAVTRRRSAARSRLCWRWTRRSKPDRRCGVPRRQAS